MQSIAADHRLNTDWRTKVTSKCDAASREARLLAVQGRRYAAALDAFVKSAISRLVRCRSRRV